jgi:hypothetical protein
LLRVFCELSCLTQQAEVFCFAAARRICRLQRLRGAGPGAFAQCGTLLSFAVRAVWVIQSVCFAQRKAFATLNQFSLCELWCLMLRMAFHSPEKTYFNPYELNNL